MKKKSELETNLFDKAMEWYQSGDRGKKEAAMELFPESLLESEIENYKKRNKKERLKLRDETLKQMLERAKKTFPIGSLIWSDDGCEDYPHLVVGEPYIGTTKYNTHIPDDVYHYWEDDNVERKTVLVHTIRLSHGEVSGNCEKWGRGIVGLERLLINSDKPEGKRYPDRPLFVDLKKYYVSEKNERNKKIESLREKIGRWQKEIDDWSKELSEWEDYDPENLTKDKLKEILNKWKW